MGAIACRLEQKEGAVRLHIVTLGVLAAFRSKGIGTQPLSSLHVVYWPANKYCSNQQKQSMSLRSQSARHTATSNWVGRCHIFDLEPLCLCSTALFGAQLLESTAPADFALSLCIE